MAYGIDSIPADARTVAGRALAIDTLFDEIVTRGLTFVPSEVNTTGIQGRLMREDGTSVAFQTIREFRTDSGYELLPFESAIIFHRDGHVSLIPVN